MRLIIVGAGKIGSSLIEKLSVEHHDIVLVDTQAAIVENMVNRHDVRGVVGNASEREVLLDAEVDKADFFIACTSRDEINIICCVLAKKLGAKHTMARVRTPEYFHEIDAVREELGIDMVFNPEYQTALDIAQILQFPYALNVESFAGGSVKMVEFVLKQGNGLVGLSMQEIGAKNDSHVLFCVVLRGDEVFVPRGDFVLAEGDHVHIIGTAADISSLMRKLHIYKQRARSVFIVGGGNISFYLAKELLAKDVKVKIIEKDEARCRFLSEELPSAIILHGDGTDQDVLDEEDMSRCYGCVALTGNDEENVILSMYANLKKVDKVITRVDRPSVMKMVKLLGLDTVVSTRSAIANQIVRFVRSNKGTAQAVVNTLYVLHEKAEALEFAVEEGFSRIGIPLKEMRIKENVLICGIVREGEYILPGGETTFAVGDHVIVVSKGKHVDSLEQIF